MDDTPETYTVHGVMAWAHSKYEVTSGTYKLVVESNGSEAKSANIVCGTDWAYDGFVFEDDPDTSDTWTNAAVNAMTAGFEVQ